MAELREELITIIGGSGFLGSHIVRALAKRDCRIRVAVRRPDLAGHLCPLGMIGQIMPVQANVRYPASLDAACSGACAVINLVGILAPSRRQSFEAIHVDGAKAVAEAARKAGAETLIHVSAIGAENESPSLYGRSKARGEKEIRRIFPEATILRPSIVFGPEDSFFNRLAAIARLSPVLPLINGGNTRLQPVFVGDVAKAITVIIDGDKHFGATYELGGPEILSFREVMAFILKAVERKRFLLPVPRSIVKAQAAILQMLPNPPLTLDQLRMLERDNVVGEQAKAEGRILAAFGIKPRGIEAIVPEYLTRFRRTGQFKSRRDRLKP
ncbi:MAG: complex I NDUFA9 subunit family protein [Hyphomicrobiales bacterium]